jgi:hypothetical protein
VTGAGWQITVGFWTHDRHNCKNYEAEPFTGANLRDEKLEGCLYGEESL